jgi:hypothetical protein
VVQYCNLLVQGPLSAHQKRQVHLQVFFIYTISNKEVICPNLQFFHFLFVCLRVLSSKLPYVLHKKAHHLMAQVSMIALMICSWVLHFEMMVWWLRRFISFLDFLNLDFITIKRLILMTCHVERLSLN